MVDRASVSAKPRAGACRCDEGDLRRSRTRPAASGGGSGTALRPKPQRKTQRPRLFKVILVNDDFTPRDFVVAVLKAVFRVSQDQGRRIMMTAHRRGVCVVAVYTRDVAETKATEGTEAGKAAGYPLMFTTEPEE
ncbi:ATP-dependent Clp protease adaptor ClpS [Nitratireductor sp. StC3]|nr:ATP-dependent Clp protease adaptor ClpS [Nitratireductor sp. StC3]